MKRQSYSTFASIYLLARRNFFDSIFSIGTYVVIAFIVLGSSITLVAYRNIIMKDHVVLLSSPFNIALLVAAMLLSVYFGVAAATATSKERESGTLLVLFTGPVNSKIFILGHFFSHILSLLFILIILLINFLALAFISQFYFPPNLFPALLYSVIATSLVVMLGIFFALTFRSNKAAIFSLILTAVFGLLLQGMDSIFYNIDLPNTSLTLNLIGNLAHSANKVFCWISPFSYLINGLTAFTSHNWLLFFMNAVSSILLNIILYILSLRSVEKQGVRP